MTTPNPDPYLDWYMQHIPHRVRAAIAGTEMLVRKLQERFGKDKVRTAGYEARVALPADSVALLCIDNAVWEGRLTATRWLIDFLGISSDKNGSPSRPAQKPHDWRIDKLDAPLFPLAGVEAQKLADIWLGCTKATSHPTRGSGHPPVDPNELNAAIAIITEYLDKQLYAPKGRNIFADTLQQHPHALVP
ncbi:MAG: hypothetical protein KF715_04490 [Candidatus Didemnitutus sp.]|nr:hypothetical protein [Candidatus Didemnitutus sp.]